MKHKTGCLIARLVELNRSIKSGAKSTKSSTTGDDTSSTSNTKEKQVEYACDAILLGSLVILWVAELVFLVIGFRFYTYLHEQVSSIYLCKLYDYF